MSFRVYIIKCLKDERCYVSYTESAKPDYNPISYLYSIYKKFGEKYITLGESIDEHGLKNHKFTFVMANLTKDEASQVTNNLREKLIDRSLNDVYDTKSIFEKELAMLQAETLIES